MITNSKFLYSVIGFYRPLKFQTIISVGQIVKVLSIKGLRRQVAKIQGLEK